MSSSDQCPLEAFIFLLPCLRMIRDKRPGHRHGIQLHQQTHKLLTHSVFPLQWLFFPGFPGNNVPLERLQTVSSCRAFCFLCCLGFPSFSLILLPLVLQRFLHSPLSDLYILVLLCHCVRAATQRVKIWLLHQDTMIQVRHLLSFYSRSEVAS